jgi:ankyrin repeat protein
MIKKNSFIYFLALVCLVGVDLQRATAMMADGLENGNPDAGSSLPSEQDQALEGINELSANLADWYKTDRLGNNFLHNAVWLGRLEDVKAFIDAGADLNRANDQGDSALDIALDTRHLEIIRALRAAGAEVSSERGSLEIVKALIGGGGADLHIKKNGDHSGQTALDLALDRGNQKIVEFILRSAAGADSNIVGGKTKNSAIFEPHH